MGLLFVVCVLSMSFFTGSVYAVADVYVIKHRDGQSFAQTPNWTEVVFEKIPNKTVYKPVRFKGKAATQAIANNSASGWAWQGRVDLNKTPYLNWCWAVVNTYKKGQAGTRKGDDYPARVYANFEFDSKKAGFLKRLAYGTYKNKYGEYPPLTVMNYIWASRLKKGEFVKNAYARNVRMLSLQHGGPYQTWRCEKRHLVNDHQQLFGKPPTPLTGVAVMTDADNTGEKATAYYGDLWFSAR